MARVTCVLFLFLFRYIFFSNFVQIHFAFLCIGMFAEYRASETLRPDLKKPFTVFMLFQCFNKVANQLQHYQTGSFFAALTNDCRSDSFLNNFQRG